MNITRENLSDLELCVKIDVEENDYIETVKKQLKDYHHKATIPGFRKGMAPMGMIERMYKPTLVGDAVQNVLNNALFKYIDDEKLNILGMPMSNDERTGEVDFAHQNAFTFYFDMALAPEFEIDWSSLGVKYNQVSVSTKDVDAEMNRAAERFGKFETPETVAVGDMVYGKVVELGKDGQPKENGVSTFISVNLNTLKDKDMATLFEGKKAEDKVVFNMGKAFAAADIERMLRIEAAEAKKFKSDVELTISGISRITPHEVDAELFGRVFPGKDIKDVEAFRKALKAEIQKANDEQSDYFFVNQMHKALVDQFSAPLPEAFLKRWFVSRDNNLTMETLEADWAEKYLPSLKWELIEGKLEQIQEITPSQDSIINAIKDILRQNDQAIEGEKKEDAERRLDQAARSIAADRDNIRQLVDQLYARNLAKVMRDQAKPEVEKVSAKEFAERAAAN